MNPYDYEKFNEDMHGLLGYCSNSSSSIMFPEATYETLRAGHTLASKYIPNHPAEANFVMNNWISKIENHPVYEQNENSQDSIIPEDSASVSIKECANSASVLNQEHSDSTVHQTIVDSYTKGCWARPAFQKQEIFVKNKSISKWACRSCHKQFTINSNTTSNLRQHLKTRHSSLASALSERASRSSDVAINQTHISKKMKVVQYTEKGMMEWIVKVCVLLNQSFLSWEHPVLFGFLDYVRPGITLPKRKMLKENIVETFNLKKKEIISNLKKVPSLCFTTDVWTSESMRSYMAVTYHYIDSKDFEMKSGLLDFSPIKGKHTGLALENKMISIFNEFGIRKSQVFTLTLDNASNNDNLIRGLIEKGYLQSGEHHIRCFAHILNLAAQDLIAEIDYIISQIRINTKFIIKSPQRLERFELVCRTNSENYRKPQLDVKTRWNSTYDMLATDLTMKISMDEFITKEGTQTSFRDLNTLQNVTAIPLCNEDWNLIKKITNILAPIKKATVAVSGDKDASVSMMMPFFDSVLDSLEKHLETHDNVPGEDAENIHDGLSFAIQKLLKYFEVSSDLSIVSTVLDPRLKLEYYSSDRETHRILVERWLLKLSDDDQEVTHITDLKRI